MTKERWEHLMDGGKGLTKEEWEQGWHYCFSKWDGLLIGPGMDEFKHCNCVPITEEPFPEPE